MWRPKGGVFPELAAIMCLSIADGVLTLEGIWRGIGVEFNPLWRALVPFPWLFLAIKTLVTGCLCIAIGLGYRHRPREWHVWAARSCVVVYLSIIVYHLLGFYLASL